MARFRGVVAGQAGEASRLGSPKSGLVVRADGWDVGVHVTADTLATNPAHDVFVVYATGGSNHRGGNVALGSVRETPEGRVFRLDDRIKLDSYGEFNLDSERS